MGEKIDSDRREEKEREIQSFGKIKTCEREETKKFPEIKMHVR